MPNYVDDKLAQARTFVGKRIEIPVFYDAWMHGCRYGRVTSVGPDGAYIRVALDRRAKPLRIWRLDYDHITVL